MVRMQSMSIDYSGQITFKMKRRWRHWEWVKHMALWPSEHIHSPFTMHTACSQPTNHARALKKPVSKLPHRLYKRSYSICEWASTQTSIGFAKEMDLQPQWTAKTDEKLESRQDEARKTPFNMKTVQIGRIVQREKNKLGIKKWDENNKCMCVYF